MECVVSLRRAKFRAHTWSACIKLHVKHDRPWTTHFTGTRSSSSSAGVSAVAAGARWAAVRRLELPLRLRSLLLDAPVFALLRPLARQQDLEPLCIRLRERAVGPQREGVLLAGAAAAGRGVEVEAAAGDRRERARAGLLRARRRRGLAPPAPRARRAAEREIGHGIDGRVVSTDCTSWELVDGEGDVMPTTHATRATVTAAAAHFSETGRGRRRWSEGTRMLAKWPRGLTQVGRRTNCLIRRWAPRPAPPPHGKVAFSLTYNRHTEYSPGRQGRAARYDGARARDRAAPLGPRSEPTEIGRRATGSELRDGEENRSGRDARAPLSI